MNIPDEAVRPAAAAASVVVQGRPMFYREARPQTASYSPLLLLHGWGGSSRYWGTTLADLGKDRWVLAPDLPGFGDSPPMVENPDPHRLAEAVLAFADALGLEAFDLNGHSFCAGVAVYVTARQPERVRRLVLTSFSTYRSERERRMVDQLHNVLALWMSLRRPWMGRWRPFYRTIGSRFFHRTPDDDAVLHAAFADFLKMERRTALATAATAGDALINPAMAALDKPTLVVGSRQDRIMPPAGTPEVARLITGSRLVWIEECGHLPMVERPALYHQIVREFLDT